MHSGHRLKTIATIILLFFGTGYLFADTLDHTIFLQEINNSQDLVYQDRLDLYEQYLNDHPDDVRVHIERCKFIQFAQYNMEEEYNPNQVAFDSCAAALSIQFPSHPEVFLFQISYKWGDELKDVLDDAERAAINNSDEWSDKQLGLLYKSMSDHHYSESEFSLALEYMEKAINADSIYATSLDYARILIELDKKLEAYDVLKAGKDTSKVAYELSNKADLYLEIEDYANALLLFNLIDDIDSTFNNNAKIASTLEGVGEYSSARKYLVADTSKSWNKEAALRNLLLHDIRYQSGAHGFHSYNAYRDQGFSADPLGLFRFKLFLSHPLLPWKFRDVFGLVTFNLALILLIIIPFVWITPIYFIGHHWNFISKEKEYGLSWGLKAFWFASAGYLIASFLTGLVEPEYLYSLFMNSYYDYELSQEKNGQMSILFILLFAVIGFALMYGVKRKILLSHRWEIKESLLYGFLFFIAFKIVTGIYAAILISGFEIPLEELSGMIAQFFTTREEIEAIIAVSGGGIAFFLICLLVPVYEEIIFRGAILDACQRYLNFNAANFIQSVLFAAVHMNLYLFPVFFVFGLIGGSLRRRSGGLLAGIVFHVINNTLAFLVLIARQ